MQDRDEHLRSSISLLQDCTREKRGDRFALGLEWTVIFGFGHRFEFLCYQA